MSLPVRSCTGCNSLIKSSVPSGGAEAASGGGDALGMPIVSLPSSKMFHVECFSSLVQYH